MEALLAPLSPGLVPEAREALLQQLVHELAEGLEGLLLHKAFGQRGERAPHACVRVRILMCVVYGA